MTLVNAQKNGQYILLSVNKGGPNPALILSDTAYAAAPPVVQSAYSSYHNSVNPGFIQKGTMSLQSLVRLTDNKADTFTGPQFDNIQQAINVISYAATLYFVETTGAIDCLKKALDKQKKALKSKKTPFSPQQQFYQQPVQVVQQLSPQQQIIAPQTFAAPPLLSPTGSVNGSRPGSRPTSPLVVPQQSGLASPVRGTQNVVNPTSLSNFEF